MLQKKEEVILPCNPLDYRPDSTIPTVKEKLLTLADESKSSFLVIEGDIELSVGHDIDVAVISVEYLPNVIDPEMIAKVECIEAK